MEGRAVRVVSWNLLYRSGAALDEIVRLVREEQPDLLLMQETTDRIDALPDRIGGHYARDPLPGRIYGLATWSREPLLDPPSVLKLQPGFIFDRICQIITLDGFAVANVHLAHGQLVNRRQLADICQVLPARAAVLGDCNLIGPPQVPGFRDVGPDQGTHALGGLASGRWDRCLVRRLNCDRSEVLVRGSSGHRPIAIELSVPKGA